jgi:hypothetical protein
MAGLHHGLTWMELLLLLLSPGHSKHIAEKLNGGTLAMHHRAHLVY